MRITLLATAIVIAIFGVITINSQSAMNKCTETHSYETCWQILNR